VLIVGACASAIPLERFDFIEVFQRS